MEASARPKSRSRSYRDDETQKEFERQQTLLAADFDKRILKGNAVTEDWRHHKVCTDLTQKEKSKSHQIRQEQQEMLKAIRKVQRGNTGHYDDSKSPMENIQEALRVKSKTPMGSSRLTVPNNYSLRKVKSQESLLVNPARLTPRPATVMAVNRSASAAKLTENFEKPKTAQPQKPRKIGEPGSIAETGGASKEMRRKEKSENQLSQRSGKTNSASDLPCVGKKASKQKAVRKGDT